MNYDVHPTGNCDQQAILELWQRNFPGASPARYAWLYQSGRADCWKLHEDSNGAVGSVGLLRRDLLVHGVPVSAGQAVDLNVDREHRSLGPALRLQQAVLEAARRQGLPLVYGVADRRSQLVLKRAGYQTVGDVDRFVKPLRSRPFVARSGSPRWLLALEPLLDLILRCSPRELLHRRPRSVVLEVTDRFDERFDRLWAEAADRFAVIGLRSSEYLNWRFADAASARYRILTLADPRGCLQGYLVYHLAGGTAHLADFLYRRPADLACLLAELVALVRRFEAEAVVLECLAPASVRRLLGQFGFWRRPSHWPMMVHADNPSAGYWREQGVFQPENWLLTRADVDTDG